MHYDRNILGFYPLKEYQCTDSFKKGIIDSKSVELMVQSSAQFDFNDRMDILSLTKQVFCLFVSRETIPSLTLDPLTGLFELKITKAITLNTKSIKDSKKETVSIMENSKREEVTDFDSDVGEEMIILKVNRRSLIVHL